MIYLTLLLHLWLHSYSYNWSHWHKKYDEVYEAEIQRQGLDQYGVTVHTFRAIGIIESGQRATLKGGGHNLFWGVFQISSTLAEKFGEYKHKEMLDVTKNTKVFASWMKYYIETWLNPLKKDRQKKGLKPLTDREWTAILYWSHNIGPGIVKYAVRKRYPIKWVMGYLKRKYSHLYDKKERRYRIMLGLLTYKLKKVSELNTIKAKESKISWWSTRKRIMRDCFNFKKYRFTWRNRSKAITKIQSKLKIPVTGVWDTITENKIIKHCNIKDFR